MWIKSVKIRMFHLKITIMKTQKLIILMLACFSFLFGCNQYELPDDDFIEIDLKKASAPAIFMVEPSGGDDTPDLMQAFEDAKTAGPGSVVQLCEGEYHVGYMQIRDFCGALKGAGKGKTIITVLPGLYLDDLFAQNLFHCMVKFVGGDVHLSHFTMQTPPGKLTESTGWPNMHLNSLLNFSAFSVNYETGNESRSINVVIDNVNFRGQYLEGGPGYVNHYNCFIAVRAGFDYFPPSSVLDNPLPREKIDFKITNCEFSTFVYGLVLNGMKNSRVIIGENNKGNIFNILDVQGGIWESRNTLVSIEGNTFNIPESSYGLDLDDWPYYKVLKDETSEKATVFNVQNNRFNMTHSIQALFVRNRRTITNPDEPAAIFQVRNNLFNMAGCEQGILSHNTRGMVLRNNKFTGHGALALYLVNYSQGGLVLGNNFSTAEFETGVAYLDQSTSDWTFVGGNFKDKVIDDGTNNVFTGMNVSTSDIPLGQSVSEKIVPMNHLME
jgi:hypothetical protein